MSDTMKVVLTGQMTGSRNGEAWPPPGTTVTLPQDEAYTLVNTGMARPVDSRMDAVELRAKTAEAAAATVDETTKAQIDAVTTTRARAARSKRAHEPANLGTAELLQPDELDNGPQLPEVNAEQSAKLEDPNTVTTDLNPPTGEKVEPTPSPKDAGGPEVDLASTDQPKTNTAKAAKAESGK